MEKYGVQEKGPEDGKKTADDSGTQTCPNCASPLMDTSQTGVAKCPKCGTKPFEEN